MDMYKIAAQQGLRFPSSRGALTAENLFNLPLKSTSGFDLDSIARSVNEELKSATTESFVEDTASDPRKEQLTVALNILKDVIKTKQDENAAARLKLQRAAQRKKLLDAIGAKKDAELTTATLEELEKKLSELD